MLPILWVKFDSPSTPQPDQVPTSSLSGPCITVADFVEEIKKKFPKTLGCYDSAQISLYSSLNDEHIAPWKLLSDVEAGRTGDKPIVARVPSGTVSAPPADSAPSSSLIQFLPCQIDFYNDVCNATEGDGWLVFNHDIPSSTLNRLYVRESYRTIASNIELGIRKATITGTAGIGKSLFLLYLLWKLVKAGKRVMLIYHPVIIYYDGKGGMFELDTIPLASKHTFWTEDLWCLFDAKHKEERDLSKIPYLYINIVLSTSPRRPLVNDFNKPSPNSKIYYMPLWSDQELGTIAPFFQTADEWRSRFRVLGGIPRHVLELADDSPSELLRNACRQCNLEDCIKIIGLNSKISEKSKVVHSLVHITSTAPYNTPSVQYASQTALDIIVEVKGKEARRKMQSLLESCNGNPLAAALCGYVFEPYAVEVLEKGGNLKCRMLEHGNTKSKAKETTLCIPSSQKEVADDITGDQTANQLYVPRTQNFTALDAWIPAIGAFQMTVGRSHDRIKSCNEELAKLGQEAQKVYWVLPPLYYYEFTKKNPQCIDQYALKIPYPSVSESD